jgi:hypothetical protein
MSGHGQKLSRKQEEAISALLTQGTLAEAAEVAGIGQATLRRWLQRDDFQVLYRRARCEAVSQAVAHLQKVSGAAVETMRVIMQDSNKPASARATAARVILEMAVKAVELEDLEAGCGEGTPINRLVCHAPWAEGLAKRAVASPEGAQAYASSQLISATTPEVHDGRVRALGSVARGQGCGGGCIVRRRALARSARWRGCGWRFIGTRSGWPRWRCRVRLGSQSP